MECSAQHIRIPNYSRQRSFNHKKDEMGEDAKEERNEWKQQEKDMITRKEDCRLLGRYTV
jgi:hypothetical protein